MSRLEFMQQEEFEEIGSALAYKIFLLEKEVGYQITKDMNGLMVMERLRMLDRYWQDQQKANQVDSKTGKPKKEKLLKR